MVLQNKHKQLASKRWNRARGNPIKKQENRSGRLSRTGASSQSSDEVDDSGNGHGSGEDDDDEVDEASAEEEFPDLPPAGGPTSHMKPPVARGPRPGQAPVDPKFARRKITSNADRYAEPEPDPYEEGAVEPTSDEEREADARVILEQHRAKPKRPSDDERGSSAEEDDEDVDHDLLARLSAAKLGNGKRAGGGIRRPAPLRPTVLEEDGGMDADSMAQMKLEKEKADAVADVKARLLGSRFAEAPQKPDRAARLAYARRGPGAQTLPTPGRQTMEADSVDDFLDSL